MAADALRWRSSVFAIETIWPAEHKVFAVWPVAAHDCQRLLWEVPLNGRAAICLVLLGVSGASRPGLRCSRAVCRHAWVRACPHRGRFSPGWLSASRGGLWASRGQEGPVGCWHQGCPERCLGYRQPSSGSEHGGDLMPSGQAPGVSGVVRV